MSHHILGGIHGLLHPRSVDYMLDIYTAWDLSQEAAKAEAGSICILRISLLLPPGVWDRHVHAAVFKMDNQQGHTAKAFDCVDHNQLWKILKEMGIPDHLTCLLRNLYAGQEATVRTGHVTTD